MTRGPMMVAGLAATVIGFGWPFLAAGHPGVLAGDAMAPVVVAGVLALVLVWLLAEVTRGGLDAKAVALLGLLTALGVALRAVGSRGRRARTHVRAGHPGGPGFRRDLRLLLRHGPDDHQCAAHRWRRALAAVPAAATSWLGLAAARCLHGERAVGTRAYLLGLLAAPAALLYGALLNLSFWPLTSTLAPRWPIEPTDTLASNLTHYLTFYFATSLGWDIARAAWTLLALTSRGRRCSPH